SGVPLLVGRLGEKPVATRAQFINPMDATRAAVAAVERSLEIAFAAEAAFPNQPGGSGPNRHLGLEHEEPQFILAVYSPHRSLNAMARRSPRTLAPTLFTRQTARSCEVARQITQAWARARNLAL